jgi:argininosuccinate lyase
MSTLWRKQTDAADWVTRFTVGNDPYWDTLLLPFDVRATTAHARGLVEAGVLEQGEFESVERTLREMHAAWERGEIAVRIEDEDCHTVIEGYLTERLGDVGKKIHTGRSRNDQVLAALRLFLRDRIDVLAGRAREIGGALCDLAETHDDAVMPGYTHLQRAMPTTAGLWAAGFAELLADDLETLAAARRLLNRSPLGSAAGYGVPLIDLPRDSVAEELGFDGLQFHVTAVQLSRGKMEMNVVHALVQLGATLNRMASDLVLFASAEFGFVTLPAEFCTGSSIMPQKKNPDVLELARATYHRLLAEFNLLLTLPANLPSGYHRDLQLTKEAVMRAVVTTEDLLEAFVQLIPGLTFNRDRMRESLTPDLFATAAAIGNVLKGVPFRDAYREAAASIGSIEVPPSAEILASYGTAGGPGNVRPDELRKRLNAGTK